jgi:DUF438 domain-containing protein
MADAEKLEDPQAKTTSKDTVKGLIKQLHEGKNPKEVKARSQNILRNISPTEIAQIEQELVNEGMPQEELRKLCDIHLSIFRESLDKERIELAANHPVRLFMEEHRIILQYLEELKGTIQRVGEAKGFEVEEEMHRLGQIAGNLMEVEKHNVREENVLFPYLQKHGITEPPTIMWAEHNELKEKKMQLLKLLETSGTLAFKDFAGRLTETGGYVAEELSSHIYKENNILYPAALQTIDDEEWKKDKRRMRGTRVLQFHTWSCEDW